MGMRFRKSVKIAPGLKVNLTKTGIGMTVGGKGAKYSVHSSGRKTASVGIPGTGVSYVNSKGGGKRKAAAGAAAVGAAGMVAASRPKPPPVTTAVRTAEDKKKYLIATAAFGWLGVHYFMAKRYKMGVLYLFTVGLFMFGWLADIVRMAMVKVPAGNYTVAPQPGAYAAPQQTYPAPQPFAAGPDASAAALTAGARGGDEQAMLTAYAAARAEGDLMSLHYALNNLIEYHYKLGKESPEHMQMCIQYCQEDIDMYEQLVPMFQKDLGSIPRLPAFQRIVMAYEQTGEYDKAIEICSFASKRRLSDGTQGGFKARRERIEKKKAEDR